MERIRVIRLMNMLDSPKSMTGNFDWYSSSDRFNLSHLLTAKFNEFQLFVFHEYALRAPISLSTLNQMTISRSHERLRKRSFQIIRPLVY